MVARLRTPRFGRAVLVLAGGAAGAQLINAAVSPILTRLFSPLEMGQLGLFLSFMYVASMTLSLRYEQAIVVAKSDADAAIVARLAGLLVPVMAVAAAAMLWALGHFQLARFETLPLVAVPTAAIGLLAFGLFGVGRYWLIRQNEYRAISEVQIVQSLGRALGQIALGIAGLGIAGLLLADLIGRAVGVARVLGAALPGISRIAGSATSGVGTMARRFWRFPVLGVPSSLMNAVAFSLPVPLLAGLYGLPVAGYFALVQRVLGLPLTVIGTSVGDALLARVSEHARDDPAAALPFFRRIALSLLAIGIPIALTVAIAAPLLFGTIFGAEWRTAGSMAALMTPWYLAALVVSPLSRVALVYEGQAVKLVYDTAALVAVIASLIGGAAIGLDALAAVGWLAVLQVGAYTIYFVILYRLVRRHSMRPPDA